MPYYRVERGLCAVKAEFILQKSWHPRLESAVDVNHHSEPQSQHNRARLAKHNKKSVVPQRAQRFSLSNVKQ